MKKYRFLTVHEIMSVNVRQINEHGGRHGIDSLKALEDTVLRPKQLLESKPKSTVYDLATAYASHILTFQPFYDGNKRTTIVSIGMFLMLNGYSFEAPDIDVVKQLFDFMIGKCDEKTFSEWLKKYSVKIKTE
jgi:death-on-curing protein